MHDLTGEVIRGRYRVLKCIGEGAMGSVYLADRNDRSGVLYALKALKPHLTHDPSFAQRFVFEGNSLQKLEHPNIVPAHDHFRLGTRYFIVLSYVDGASLADLLQAHGRLPPAQALAIIKPILNALDHAHQRGIIHRDVKPSNILIDQDGRPLLCDFGIARDIGRAGITRVGMTLGTPEYMSPEQVLGLSTLNHCSDVYSAGVVLFEMLTGHVPFEAADADSSLGIRRHHVQTEAPDPRTTVPSLSERLARIVLKALRKDPARRYSGCSDFRRALEEYERDEAGVAMPEPALPSLPGSNEPPAHAAGSGSRSYLVYVHPTLEPAAVKQGFSWPALFANVFWMLAKGLHRQALTWIAGWIGLLLVVAALAQITEGIGVIVLALLMLGGVLFLVVTPGLRGNRWLAVALADDGYRLQKTVRAPTAQAAVLELRMP